MSESEISKNFKEHSVAEFFKKNKQMLGFSGKIRSLTTILHEYITNSLDACQEAKILPEINVEINEIDKENEKYEVIVEDNGPGIPKSHIGKALGMMLSGTKFHRFIQQRGQQGIGAAGCTMFSMLTVGKPVKVTSGCNGKVIECEVSVDFKTNKPIIENEKEIESSFQGLRIQGQFGEVKYEKSNYGPYEYIRRTALANPYLKITFKDPSGQIEIFQRSADILPPKPIEIVPHPLGIGPHELLEIAKVEKKYTKLSSFFQNRFSRFSAGKIAELKEVAPEIDFEMSPEKLSWQDAEKITNAFSKIKWVAPSPEGITPIGQELIEKSFINVLSPEMVAVTERKPKIYKGGIPFIIEVGIGYGGGVESAGKKGEVMRFANRSPLLFDAGGCAITETIKNMDWKRYDLKNFEEEPIVIVVNISSVHIPYTSAGKQAISPEEEVVDEIKNAIMETCRSIQKHISGKRKEREMEGKKKAISRYIGQFSKDLAELSESSDSEKIKEVLESMIGEKYGE